MSLILLGLVGTPASGKSTVAGHLQEKGALWINADLVARDVLQQADVTSQLTEHFGSGILDANGAINRSALAGLVFGETVKHKAALDYLESVIHPPTRQEILRRLRIASKESVQVAILDVPLLFESGWHYACDTVWCIDAPLESRVHWSAARGWNNSELQRRESNQLAIADKQRLSNVILLNEGTLAELQKKVDEHWQNLVTMGSTGADFSESNPCFADDRTGLE